MRRILIIAKHQETFTSLKSTLDTVEGKPFLLDWVHDWDEIPDTKVLRKYHIVLVPETREDLLPAPVLLPGRELAELQNRLVNMASHEFRTPLTSISSSTDLVEAYLNLGDYDKIGKHISRIKRSVNELNVILTEFVSLKKIEEGITEVDLKQMDLPELAMEVQEGFRHLLKSGQTILCLHDGPKTVLLDPVLLKIILINLLSNASKFSSAGSTITIHTVVQPGMASLDVTDTGIGIPVEDQHHIFNRFYRARNVVNIQGMGLGLHLTKKYVELMHGAISFSSSLEHGTTFDVVFQQAF